MTTAAATKTDTAPKTRTKTTKTTPKAKTTTGAVKTVRKPRAKAATKTAPKAAPAVRKTAAVKRISRTTRTRMTKCVAAMTPLMGFAFAHVAASLAVNSTPTLAPLGDYARLIALAPAAVTAFVLFVSLPHVAHGLREVTGQNMRNCTALAVGIDAGMIVCKGLLLLDIDQLAIIVLWVMLVASVVMSGFLNYIAYSVVIPDTDDDK